MNNIEEVHRKASRVKAVFFDVDGTMTGGTVTIDRDGNESMTFSKRDGLGMSLLMKMGVKVGWITGSKSPSIVHRAKSLGIDFLAIGKDTDVEKLETLNQACGEWGVSLEEVGYMGDDLNDLECLRAVGFSACPGDAAREVSAIVDHETIARGGDHAVREACDFILKSRRVWL